MRAPITTTGMTTIIKSVRGGIPMKVFNKNKTGILIAALVFISASISHADGGGDFAVSQRLSQEQTDARVSDGESKAAEIQSPLYDLIETAYENNPGISAARSQWRAAVEKYPQARSLPDPMFGFTWFPSPVETRLGANRGQFKLSQMFPARGKLRLQGDRAGKMADAARLKYEIIVRDVITDLRASYAELRYFQEAIQLTQKNKELVERLLVIAERDYAEGGNTLQDVLRTQSQLAQVSYDLLLLEELRETEVTRINALLNRDPETEIVVSPLPEVLPPEFDLETLYELAQKTRQEILLADIQIELGEIGVGLAGKVGKPNYTVGLVYNTIGESINPSLTESGRDAWGISVGMTLPIWKTRNKAAVKDAHLKLNAASYTKQERINMANSMIKNLFFKIRTSGHLVELYEKTLVPQARKSLELSETWYNSEQASFSEMLEVQAVWLNFELARVRARTDLAQNIAKLEQVLGTSLPEKGGE